MWTFHDDVKDYNQGELETIFNKFKFSPIDQSSRGSNKVDNRLLVDELKKCKFKYHDGDFIKIVYTISEEGIYVQDVTQVVEQRNPEITRIIELMNYSYSHENNIE